MPSRSGQRILATVASCHGTSGTDVSNMPTILNSWKEIASYVGRGIRTVQRWERELGLPVRRPRGHLRSPVVAIPSELDDWLRQPRPVARVDRSTTGRVHIRTNGKELAERSKLILQRTQELQDALARTSALITRLTRAGVELHAAPSSPHTAKQRTNGRASVQKGRANAFIDAAIEATPNHRLRAS
jgi:hypothetical protein